MATIPVNNMTDTWNASGTIFKAINMVVTNTASATGSCLGYLKNGSAIVNFSSDGRVGVVPTASGGGQIHIGFGDVTTFPGNLQMGFGAGDANTMNIGGSNGYCASVRAANVSTAGISAITGCGFHVLTSGGGLNASLVCSPTSGNISLLNFNTTTSACGLQVYNTTDAVNTATNYERGVFDWTTTANTLTIGTQKGGTGSGRQVAIDSVNGQIALQNSGSLMAFLSASNSTFDLTNNMRLVFETGGTGSGDSGLSRTAAKVLEFGDGGANANGWLNWAGESRTTASQNFTSTTTFAAVTGLTVNVQAGRTYRFKAHIPVTAGGNAGGIKVNIAGTCTATAIIYDVWAISSNAITGQAQATALAAANAGSVLGAATGFVEADGIITVNAAGTLIVQAAQNTSNATSTTTAQGASFFVDDTQ